MRKNINIRLAEPDDCASILQIYTPYVTGTAISFECQVPDIAEFSSRMAKIQSQYPWIVCEIDAGIIGYAYAYSFKQREAYNWSVESSIYINQQYHQHNIGKALYYALFNILKLQGYCNVYAGVTLPNIKSERLHESMGFKTIGTYPRVGYKLGKWHDVKWYALKINEYNQAPAKPKNINEVSDTKEFRDILRKSVSIIGID
jgi:L-amino acid N-acyltransferase YncA